jgi:hypothetical protein
MRQHEHERLEPDRAASTPDRPQPIHDVFALQRSAGNQAVAAMLARQPTTTETLPAQATLSKLGVIPLYSFSRDISGPGRHGEASGAITCVSPVGTHSAPLQQLMLAGEAVDAELLLHKSGFKIELKNAHISSYSVGGDREGIPTEIWTLEPLSKKAD